jgi:hypothetical protein
VGGAAGGTPLIQGARVAFGMGAWGSSWRFNWRNFAIWPVTRAKGLGVGQSKCGKRASGVGTGGGTGGQSSQGDRKGG